MGDGGEVRITAVEALARRRDRVALRFDGAERIEVSAEVWARTGLAVGAEVDAGEVALLKRRDHAWQAREAALRLLSYRSRSAAELRRRLLRQDFEPEITDACLAELRERGLLNDADFAAAWVRDRLRFRPRGRKGLLAELRAKGVDAATAGAAIDEVLESDPDAEATLARAAAAKWRPRPGEEPVRARRRIEHFLARRGFAADVVREAAAARLAEVALPE
jgi:regulatory protein